MKNKPAESIENVYKYRFKNSKGITLVALVVTIVVLLILAGVSINLVLGQNGLIANAKEAKEKTLSATNDESYLINEVIPNFIEKQMNASGITAADYGKVVTNYQTGTENVWEIFYADSNNVYLITRNNVGKQTLNDKITGYNGTSDFDGSNTFKEKFPAVQAGWLNKIYEPSTEGAGKLNYTSSYDNMKATEYLLDSSIWNVDYKTDKSDWAIGASTEELFVAAYNKKFKDKVVTIKTPTSYGYDSSLLNSNNSLPSSDSITSGNAQSNLFNHGYYYWIACPGSYNGAHVRCVRDENACVNYGDYVSNLGVRPVVCLNSSTTLTPSADGNTFTIN